MKATVTITMTVSAHDYAALAWWMDSIREKINAASKISNAEDLVETSLHITGVEK